MPADDSPPAADRTSDAVDFAEIRDVLDTAARDAGHDDVASFVTDLFTDVVENPPEPAPEPPNEVRYGFHEEAFDGDYDEAAARVTKAVAAVTPRELGTLDFWGLDVSRPSASDALAVLAARSGVEHTDTELVGEIPATVEAVAAVADLYATPVVEVLVTDVEGSKVIERRDGHYLWVWLPEDRLERVMARLPKSVGDAVERADRPGSDEAR
ncbi:hypothetical protein SAMN04487949_0439 [Halogranum gelatinilyticum]|uniref:Uncharacterized protein n=1 Tax=Halogranum gelatinilyticum TaxID=660521 RepID=A0A1G9PLE9_9EURY|nr:hypothetical protein [Halogranum gelatinilyticum]SDL99658.1 hypothetical protein SAMN04487949_0439 [Halogranum gelatinilyticum]